MTEKEIREAVVCRVKAIMEEKRYTQKDILGRLAQIGWQISQSELSRLLAGNVKISLYQISALARVFDMSLDELVNGNSRQIEVYGEKLVRNIRDSAFDGWRGKYFTIFSSTAAGEDKIIRGELFLEPGERGCDARYSLNTGEKNVYGVEMYKEYRGVAVISNNMQVVYIILNDQSAGELCFVEFRYRIFRIKDAECRMGLVLTTSAGEEKTPTAHRMFLTRNELTQEQIGEMRGALKFAGKQIRIEKNDLDKLLTDTENKANYVLCKALEKEYAKEVIEISYEELVYKLSREKCSKIERAEAIGRLLRLCKNEMNVTVGKNDDDMSYDMLHYLRHKEE